MATTEPFREDLRVLVNSRTLVRYDTTDTRVPVSLAAADLVDHVAKAYAWPRARRSAGLRQRGLVTESGTLTVAGALARTDPAVSLRAAKFHIDIRGYERDAATSYVRRDEVRGPVHEQVSRATEIVLRDIGTDIVVTGARRHDVSRLPRRAVREVIANAVAHRSYEHDLTPVELVGRKT